MTKQKTIFFTLFTALLGACQPPQIPTPPPPPPPPAPVTGFTVDHTNFSPEAASDAQVAKVFLLDQYFEHASVGGNVTAGLAGLTGRYTWPAGTRSTTNYDAALELQDSAWFDSHDGLADLFRGYPPGKTLKAADKLEQFRAALKGGLGSKVDVASFKFCYLDRPADPAGLFNQVKTVMEELEGLYPSVTFFWWTMPHQTWGSNQIHEYNQLVRNYCQTTGRWLLDISDLETHAEDGTACLSGGYPILYSGYTTDGGHLNPAGQERMAKAWWRLMAAIAASR